MIIKNVTSFNSIIDYLKSLNININNDLLFLLRRGDSQLHAEKKTDVVFCKHNSDKHLLHLCDNPKQYFTIITKFIKYTHTSVLHIYMK